MTNKIYINNRVEIRGKIVSTFMYSHEVFGEKFYTVSVLVYRLSDSSDILSIIISERLIDIQKDYRGCFIKISGQLRSYNKWRYNKNRLILSIFAQEIKLTDMLPDRSEANNIFLDGFLCKTPTYRKTPLGREITDVLLAVNRLYNKSDYIPCICWGSNARFAKGLIVGSHIRVSGRIQSREYQKKISETENETRMAYEVSISRLECLEN